MTMLSRFEDRYLVLQELHHRGDGMPEEIMIRHLIKTSYVFN